MFFVLPWDLSLPCQRRFGAHVAGRSNSAGTHSERPYALTLTRVWPGLQHLRPPLMYRTGVSSSSSSSFS